MIQIQQDMCTLSSLETIVNKMGEIQIGIDTDSVKSDIDALENKELKPLNKIDKKNIKEVKGYIEKLLSKCVDSVLDMVWRVENLELKAYPIDFIHIPEYNIEMADYITAGSEHLVRVDYRDVLEIIAIEMMYRDLGESMETMEETLCNLGITGIHPAYELLNIFDESILKLSKILRISDSPYTTTNLRISVDYFNKRQFNGKFYNDNVSGSVNTTLAIITQHILTKLNSNNISYKLCSVSNSGIYFITPDSDVNINNILNESAVVRAFGRRFEVKPKVTVF